MSKAEEKDLVRINVILPAAERDAFDMFCRYGPGEKVSMSWRIRQLMKADVDRKINVPKKAPPYAHRIKPDPDPAKRRKR